MPFLGPVLSAAFSPLTKAPGQIKACDISMATVALSPRYEFTHFQLTNVPGLLLIFEVAVSHGGFRESLDPLRRPCRSG